MPIPGRQVGPFKPTKDIQVNWETWVGGWNSLFKPTELEDNELAQADNLMLIGKGVPTGRWGSEKFNLAGTGRVRFLATYRNSLTATNLLLSITDAGFLTKKNGASFSIITGASFASGLNVQGVQLANNIYMAAATLPFVKFDGTELIPFLGLAVPTNVSIAQLSAATGFEEYSWRISASSRAGETIASISKSLTSLPLDLTLTSVKVSWDAVSAASGDIKGYNIYRGFRGFETFVSSTSPENNEFIDTGAPQSNLVFPRNVDTTAGIRAKYILRFDDRLVLAGIAGEPSRVYISARFPNQDSFSAIDGGGYADVSPNDGEDVTGLGISNNQGSTLGPSAILVFKENSVHRIALNFVTIGNFLILDPNTQLLTPSNGCSSGDSIVAVENDTYYFGRKGIYVVGQEPTFLNQIRTNELSARIRPYIRNLSDTDFREASAGYLDNKYILSFPTKKETIIYDRERLAFMGPWKTPQGITEWLRHFDGDGVERFIAGGDDGFNREFGTQFVSDDGAAIAKVLRTKKTDMGAWNMMKILKLFYILLRNVRGTVVVNIRLEERSGNTVVTKSFSVTSDLGSGGWGADQFGLQQWGETEATIVLTGEELVRWAQLYKQARVAQVEITTSGANSNFEYLSTNMTADSLGPSSLPATTRV